MQTESHDNRHDETTAPGHPGAAGAALEGAGLSEAVLSEAALNDALALVEAAPLGERAAGFDVLHDRLLAELQGGDHVE